MAANQLFITEIDPDGNPVRTEPYVATPTTPAPAYVQTGATMQRNSNPLYLLLGLLLLASAIGLATLTLYHQGKLDPAIAWLAERGIDVAPIVEVLDSNPVGSEEADESVGIPEGVVQPLPEAQPEPVQPPLSPDAPDIAALVPQPQTPFYEWEAPALDPSSPNTWPAMTAEQQAAFLVANPDWSERVAAAQAPPAAEPVAVAPEPEAPQTAPEPEVV